MSRTPRPLWPLSALLLSLSACDATRPLEAPADVSANVALTNQFRWTVVDLGAPTVAVNASFFTPMGVSNAGHVTGQGKIGEYLRAISVSPAGVWTVKRPMPGDVKTFPGQINSAGLQVGISVIDQQYSELEAVVWDADGNPTKIPGLPRSPQEWAGTINDRGYVAGETMLFGSPVARPFVWHISWPAVRALSLPASSSGGATVAMNGNGEITGYTSDAEHPYPYAVIWDTTGARRALPILPGSTWTYPLAINDVGVVGGWALRDDQTFFAWSWTARRGYVTYETPSGFTSFQIVSIDNQSRLYAVAFGAANQQQVFMIVNGKVSPVSAIDGGTPTGLASLSGIMAGTATVNGVARATAWIPKK